jgi:hypothetical protein
MKQLLRAGLLAMAVSAPAWVRQHAYPLGSGSSYRTYQVVGDPAQRREAITLQQHTAVRLAGKADTAFVQRVLPHSYAGHPEYYPSRAVSAPAAGRVANSGVMQR